MSIALSIFAISYLSTRLLCLLSMHVQSSETLRLPPCSSRACRSQPTVAAPPLHGSSFQTFRPAYLATLCLLDSCLVQRLSTVDQVTLLQWNGYPAPNSFLSPASSQPTRSLLTVDTGGERYPSHTSLAS
ncbi:hypothetical protein ASPTUDRAFT_38627 [Aspergillus tubingensis CBS 134.48]|uniref:Secreted protein n=1 Tax=Aspergillus tubingensis (strain CBS 134.48) TaxID=767770 RepID=A0A1L9NQR1_ASPTC|nr:hypothetical protein ASPTUDRAFT_38627 [Aspergillus tubingensis CBS 134.48]